MPLDGTTPPLRLSQVAQDALRVMFAQGGHSPSAEQWSAINDLLAHFERAASGQLQPAVYLSAIPAGTGKTATVAQFAKALMADPSRSGTGMLITCNRVTEVEEMAAMLQGWRHQLCILVGQDNIAVLAMGDHKEANEAQVVVCTQAALKQTLKAVVSFNDATRFHYHGQRRAVIAWDEAFAFSRPVMLDPDAAMKLAKAMQAQSPAAKKELLQWSIDLTERQTGPCPVPDFAALGVDFRRLEDDVADDDDAVAQAKALSIISGGSGYIMRDNLTGGCLVSHHPEIPASLMPVIVTDASAALGVHHESYEMMAKTHPVTRLQEAGKTYRNLSLRIIPTAASRAAYGDRKEPRGLALINMAISYIQRVAPAPVLVVGYRNTFAMKGVQQRTIEAAIRHRLTPAENGRVDYLTWGRHTATNAYKNYRHVVIMGLNYLPRPAAHAAAGAVLDLPMRTAAPGEQPSESQVDVMRRGMLRDSTLQALLRGHARKGADGDCGAMAAIVFQGPQAGLTDEEYRAMFPMVDLSHDTTLRPPKPLKGNLKRLAAAVMARVDAGETEMANPDLARDLGMKPTDFRRIIKHPDWQAWIEARGLVPCTLKARANGLRRRP